MAGDGRRDFWRVLASLVLPPLGVFLQVGLGIPFWINLALFFLVPFWIPAQLHAVWVISTVGPGGREDPDGMATFLSLLVSFWLPPIGVWMKRGIGVPLVINIVLTLLMWLPGAIHALWVITHDDG